MKRIIVTIFFVLLVVAGQAQTKVKRLKAYPDVDYYTEDGVCKYTCGNTTDYGAVQKTKNEVQKKYKDAFVIAVYQGKKISVKEAREITSKNK